MALLHIYDSSDSRIVQTANQRGAVNRLPISNANNLQGALDRLVTAGSFYDRILFETHGSPGRIYFGNVYIDAAYWNARPGRYNNLAASTCRIYFNGCNVAEGSNGWSFLESVVGCFMTSGGGEVFGQTSIGFGNPFNGHVVHLWGTTKRLYVRDGRIIERFEQ